MSLRSKLVVSFLGVLTLSALVGLVGWYGMSIMGRRADQAVTVQNAGMDLLLAKVSQLRFIVFDDPREIELTKKYLAESIETFRASLATIDQPERLEETRGIIVTLGRYQNMVATLEQRAAEIAKLDAALGADIKTIQLDFKTLLGNIENTVRETGSAEEFDFFDKVSDARVLFSQALSALLEYRIKPTRDMAELAIQATAACRDNLEQVGGALHLPANITLMKSMQQLLSGYDRMLAQVIEMRAAQDSLIADIHSLVIETVTTVRAAADNANELLKGARAKALLFVILITAAAFGLGILISWLLTSSILRQLGKDPGELAAIARRVSQGDFAIEETGRQIGVFGALVEMVKTLRSHIENARLESERARAEADKAREAIQQAEQAHHEAELARREGILDAANQLEGIVNEVNSAADRLSTQIESAKLGSSEQAGRATETATAMEEMNNTILEVARNAAAGSEASVRTRKKAEEGSQVMEKALKSIRVVHEQSAKVRNNILTLTEHVRAIDRIMGVISDIADQTNLLALNAAIEAARAGDAGRGFAVVADEVRKLAEKTMASTTDVEKMVRDIQRSAEENMRQVDVTVQEIESATTLAGQSGEKLGEILTLVDDTADQARSIATASEEQSAASEQINRSMTQINAIAGQTAQAMEEAARAVSDLARQTTVLNQLVDHLKQN